MRNPVSVGIQSKVFLQPFPSDLCENGTINPVDSY